MTDARSPRQQDALRAAFGVGAAGSAKHASTTAAAALKAAARELRRGARCVAAVTGEGGAFGGATVTQMTLTRTHASSLQPR